MKNKNGIYIIGVDHGYGNIKTANCCFPTGVGRSDTEATVNAACSAGAFRRKRGPSLAS